MYTTNNLIKLLFSIGFLLFNTHSLSAQNCECQEIVVAAESEQASLLTMIGEEDYPNFLTISSLKKYSNIKYEGNFDSSSKIKSYVVKGDSKRVKLSATYDKEGKLIEGKLVKIDFFLPKTISRTLVSDIYKDWAIKSTKTIVKDFDAQSTQYEVKIQKGKEKQELYFDYAGKPIKKLARI